ncbi:hypothetical protein VULLAG_LOCUS14093 [Vulpes lagopus]
MRADADGRRGPGRAPISEGPGLPEAPRRGGRLYRKGAAATGVSRASRVPLPTHDTRGGGSRKPRPYRGPGRKAPGKQGPGRCDPPAGAPSRPSPAGSPGPRCRCDSWGGGGGVRCAPAPSRPEMDGGSRGRGGRCCSGASGGGCFPSRLGRPNGLRQIRDTDTDVVMLPGHRGRRRHTT